MICHGCLPCTCVMEGCLAREDWQDALLLSQARHLGQVRQSPTREAHLLVLRWRRMEIAQQRVHPTFGTRSP